MKYDCWGRNATFRGVGVWAFGSVGVWECGRLGVWAFGSVGVWECGRLGLRGEGLGATRSTYAVAEPQPRLSGPVH